MDYRAEHWGRIRRFSVAMWIAGYWPMGDIGLVLKASLGVLAEFLGGFTRIT